jgi:hypothetical protein
MSVLEIPYDAYAVHLAAEKVFDEWVAHHRALPQTTERRWSGSTLPTGQSDDASAAVGDQPYSPDHGSLIAHAPEATLTIATIRIANPRVLTRVSVRIDPNSMSMNTATQETHDILERIKTALHAPQ